MRKRGRRVGASNISETIRNQAASAFREHGYDGVTVRAIAALADVDSALIFHYFKSKRGLFEASTESGALDEISPIEITRSPAPGSAREASAGERIVRSFVAAWDRPGARVTMSALLRSAATDAESKRQLIDLIERTIVVPANRSIDPKRGMAKLRAALVAAQLIGIAWMRYVLETEPIATASPSIVARTLGESIDATLLGLDFGKR